MCTAGRSMTLSGAWEAEGEGAGKPLSAEEAEGSWCRDLLGPGPRMPPGEDASPLCSCGELPARITKSPRSLPGGLCDDSSACMQMPLVTPMTFVHHHESVQVRIGWPNVCEPVTVRMQSCWNGINC